MASMYCPRCASKVNGGQAQCKKCGLTFGSSRLPPKDADSGVGGRSPSADYVIAQQDQDINQGKGLQTPKLIVGIISIVLFFFVSFQSCVAGLGGALLSEEDTSGAGGIILAFCMLIAGIVGIVTRKSKGGGITAGVFYLIGALAGFANLGIFGDLVIWSVMSVIFAAIYLIGSASMGSQSTKPIYKRVWVWIVTPVFVILILGIIVGNNGVDEPIGESPATAASASQASVAESVQDTEPDPASGSSPEDAGAQPQFMLTYGNTFEFDGFEITIGREVEWDSIKNQFSDKDGMDVAKLPIHLKNLREETATLSRFSFDLFGSSGTKLDNVSSYIDGSLSASDKMRPGAEHDVYICFLYDGDGDYYIEFSTIRENYEVAVPIQK